MLDLTDEIAELMTARNMDESKVEGLITDMLKSAYKRKFGTDENAVVKFNKDNNRIYVEILARKEVVN